MKYLTDADFKKTSKKQSKTTIPKKKYLTDADFGESKPKSVAPVKPKTENKSILEKILSNKGVSSFGRASVSAGEGLLKGIEGVTDFAEQRIGDVAGLFSDKAKKKLYDDSKVNIVDNSKAVQHAKEVYDRYSYNPFKSGKIGDSIAQGVGQVASFGVGGELLGETKLAKTLANGGKIAKGASKALQLAPIFASSAGQGTSEALNKGASYGKANAYGLGTGAIESGTESLFGGIGGVVGKGPLDDMVVNAVKKKISSKIGKELAELGIKATGEGLEEVVSGVLSPFLKRATYDKNAENYSLKQAGQDFTVGALTSGILQSPGTINNIVSKENPFVKNSEKQAEKPVIQAKPIDQVQLVQEQQKEPEMAVKQLEQTQPKQTEHVPLTKNEQTELNHLMHLSQIPNAMDKADESRLNELRNKERSFEQAEQNKTVPIKQQTNYDKLNFGINQRIDKIKSFIDENFMSGFKDHKVKYSNEIYRNVEQAFNPEARKIIQKEVLEPFDKAKLNHVNMLKEKSNELLQKVEEFGIKKGSLDSSLVQQFGEKKIDLPTLQSRTKNWKNVVEFDKWFRQQYDDFVDKINQTRVEIYPNTEKNILEAQVKLEKITKDLESKKAELNGKTKKDTILYRTLERQIETLKNRQKQTQDLLNSEELWRGKRIPKRNDYYRHFQEMSDGFKELFNIVSGPSDISSNLAGISDFTKPNAKFLGLAQERKTETTKSDAVGGYLDYLKPASYAINIDPQIKVFRELAREIATKTQDQPQANKFIEYLHDYSNGLAGKTNPIDRPFQKLLDRKTMKTIEWFSNRIKANTVLGNLGSSVAQVLNLPQGIADVGNPIHIAKGFATTVKNAMTKGDAYKDSQFISERFLDIDTQFDTKLLDQPKNFAKWLLNALDEVSTKFIWNSEYSKAKAEKIDNPISYADNQTRKMVGGRGIGEKTITQSSRIVGVVMPFTLEVGNNIRVIKDFSRNKQFGKLIIMFILANLLNKGIEKTGASGKTFDPIQAIKDALTEDDLTALERVGRVGGEVLGNLPMGQQIASVYPENGADLKFTKLPTRKKLFGSKDPTRFGTGSVLTKAITDPLTSVITPWGGSQIKKTIDGLSMYSKDKEIKGSYTSNGDLRFPVGTKTSDKVQAALLGQYSSKNAREYFDNKLMPIKKEKANDYKNIPTKDYVKFRTDLNKMNKIESNKDRYGKTIRRSATAKKMFYIMQLDESNDYKNKMLEFLSKQNRSNHKITTEDLKHLKTEKDYIEFFSY